MNSQRIISTDNLPVGLCFTGLFIILPFSFSLLLIFFVMSFNQVKSCQIDKIFINILSLYLSLINSTKIPKSDMENYQIRFMEVSEYTFLDYIFGYGEVSREPIFNLLTYAGYYLTFGSFQFFIFLISLVIFFLQFSAIRRYCFYYEISSQRFFLSCIFLGMFYSYFSLTAHLIRQCLGLSVVMYILVVASSGGYFNKWLFLFTSFIHSAALFFLPFLFFKKTHQRMSLITITKLILTFFFLYYAFNIITIIGMSIFNSIQAILYIFSRVSDMNSFIEIGGVNNQDLMLITATILFLYSVYALYIKKSKLLSPLVGHAVIFCCLIVFFFNNHSLIQYRVFFMLYGFFPYLLISLPKLNYKYNSIAVFMLSLIIYFIFLNDLENGHWDYASKIDLLINNPITLTLKFWS